MANQTEAQKIAEMVQEIRRRENLTQQALADAAKVQQAGIARMESGESLQNIDVLVRVFNAAGYELRIVAVKKAAQIERTL